MPPDSLDGLITQSNSSNDDSDMGDSLAASGSQPGGSRGVVRQSQKQMTKVLTKKKRKIEVDTDSQFSEKLVESNKSSTREVISLIQSAIDKPSTPSTSLISFGQWVANVTSGLHPTLENAWTKEVSTNTM